MLGQPPSVGAERMPVGIERVVDEVAVELEDWTPVPELALGVVDAD